MSPLLLFSIALVIGSLVGSIVLFVRSGEVRVGLFGGLFLVFAIHQGIELWFHWGVPFAANASAATAIAGVLEGLLSVGIVLALSRTLGERDRVEAIHWDSMEAVRVMNELSTDNQIAFEAKTARLLEIGKKRYGMEVGMLSRVSNERYEVLAVDAPKSFPFSRGAVLSLGETFCKNAIESERPIAIEHITESSWTGRPDRAAFRYDAYLGAAVRVGGLPYGTLSFASSERRKDRFTATDKDLVRLMAQWLGTEIERRDGIHAYIEEPLTGRAPDESTAGEFSEEPAATAARVISQTPRKEAPRLPPTSGRDRRELDVNKVLARLEKQLGAALGDSISLELKLEPGLGLAAVSRLPIDAIVRTLVMNAKDAMADGGQLVIETANLELAGVRGVMPAIAPDRYVTIAVKDTGAEPDADTLSRLYDPSPSPTESDFSDPRPRLTLSTLYRLLQNCGGDLSVDVEQGAGSTFTVYLPRAKEIPIADTTPPSHSAPTSVVH